MPKCFPVGSLLLSGGLTWEGTAEDEQKIQMTKLIKNSGPRVVLTKFHHNFQKTRSDGLGDRAMIEARAGGGQTSKLRNAGANISPDLRFPFVISRISHTICSFNWDVGL